MRSWKFLLPLLASSLCFAAQPDRITGPIDSSQMVALTRSVHSKAKPQYDLGAVDPSLKLDYVTLLMAPSLSQQKALDQLLAQQQDHASPNYHKWLTPQQFADRFGLSENDLNKVTAWLKSQGFQILSTGGGRNSVIFSGTAAQVQSAFATEIHNYKVDGEEHIANSTPIMVPAALNGIVRSVMGLHNFRPRPAYRTRGAGAKRNAQPGYYDANYFFPNFLAPGDIATIYGITSLYNASTPIDGAGQTLAIAGQTDIFLADINDFRSGFGLSTIPVNTVATTGECTINSNGIVISPCNTTNFQYVLLGTDTGSVSDNDIGEADLDIEWSGAVARNAQIIFINGETNNGVFDALTAAINPPVGPPLALVVSASYGEGCEAQATLDLETVLQQGNAEGVTIMNSSGDIGAAECDFNPPNNAQDPPFSPAIGGVGVSYPASSPEVTGVGGTAISLADDTNPPNPSLWSTTIGANGGTAVTYIPELGWNDDVELAQYCQAPASGDTFCSTGGGTKGWVPLTTSATASQMQQDIWISSSGGGASNCWYENGDTCLGPGPGPTTGGGFAQPTWQQGLVVPGAPAGVRYVPDVSLFASPNFPGYVFCTPQNPNVTNTSTCASGIFTAVDTYQSLVGGTSVSSPAFAGIVTLLNQYVVTNGLQSTAGLGNVNSNLYYIAANNPSAFNQVKTGTNTVYCQPGTPSTQPTNVQCPSGGSLGYSASNADPATGYNLVTGLGSVNVDSLALAWGELFTATTTSVLPSSTSIPSGGSVTFTATVTPSSATGVVRFYDNSSTTAIGSASVSGGTATFTTSALPAGTDSIVGTYNGINAASTSSPVAVTVTAPFTMSASPPSFNLAAGQSVTTMITVTPASSSPGMTINFSNTSCAGLPANGTCTFTPASVNGASAQTVQLTIFIPPNIAPGALPVIVTGTASGTTTASETTTVNLTVTANTTESFSITTPSATVPVIAGQTAQIAITVNNTGTPSFINASSNTTALPLTYSCSGLPSESTCTFSPGNGQAISQTALTLNIATTASTSQLRPPLGHGSRIFYAMLLPGLFGIVFAGGSRSRAVRLLGLIVVLGFSTLWLGSCGGSSSSQNNPGTPAGTYTVTVNATTGAPTGGTALTGSFTVNLTVTQ